MSMKFQATNCHRSSRFSRFLSIARGAWSTFIQKRFLLSSPFVSRFRSETPTCLADARGILIAFPSTIPEGGGFTFRVPNDRARFVKGAGSPLSVNKSMSNFVLALSLFSRSSVSKRFSHPSVTDSIDPRGAGSNGGENIYHLNKSILRSSNTLTSGSFHISST